MSHEFSHLGTVVIERREPTEADLKKPLFEYLWCLLKDCDVEFEGGMKSGVTGNDVAGIMDAIEKIVHVTDAVEVIVGDDVVPAAPEKEVTSSPGQPNDGPRASPSS